MTDYLNPHKLYPDDISRRIDIPPGFDSVRDNKDGIRPAVKDSLTTERMTREDAIFFLNELRSANNCDETIDMAIAALFGWVRTADRVPENGDDVLVCYDDEITIGCYVGHRWYYVITRDLEYKADIWGRVKYWMPLPPLPESVGLEGTKINGGE